MHSPIQPVGSFPCDKYAEVNHSFLRVDLAGKIRWAWFPDNPRYEDQQARNFRCEELRAKRVTQRILRNEGIVPTRSGCGRDCTGRVFTSSVEIIHVDTSYEYAIVKVSQGTDI